VKSLNPTLDAQALRALSNWLFKPALGTDGQPFAARIPIQITYNLNQP
jgi:outer membrane biosynthesis protein TonB